MTKKPVEYTDIGHSKPDDMLWVEDYDGTIEMRRQSEGTHLSLWGMRSMGMWKGRYESATARLSIVPPAGHEYDPPPRHLLDSLEAAVGPFELFSFNPLDV